MLAAGSDSNQVQMSSRDFLSRQKGVIWVNKSNGGWRLMLMIGFCSSSFIMLSAQSTAPSDSGIVTVRLLSPSPIACFGQSEFPFEAVLTNKTDTVIEVSKNGVGGFYFEKLLDGKVVNSQNGVAEVEPGNWVRISPRQSVIAPFGWGIAPGTSHSEVR